MQNPTHDQFKVLRRQAIDMGANKEVIASLLADGSLKALMQERIEQLRADGENIRTIKITAMVAQDGDFIQMLEEAGPDTPDDFAVRQVGDLYLSDSKNHKKVDFILRNYPKGGGSWGKALAWAETHGYEATNPRELFSAVSQNDLKSITGRDWLCVVATMECSFGGARRGVCVRMGGSDPVAGLYRLERFGDDYGWFLFRKSA